MTGEIRQFYQIYRDAPYFHELFEIEEDRLMHKTADVGARSTFALILGRILRTLGGWVREFHGGQQQYKIYLEDGTEIKFSNPFSCGFQRRYFIQISADSIGKAQAVFNLLMSGLKEFFEGEAGEGEAGEVKEPEKGADSSEN